MSGEDELHPVDHRDDPDGVIPPPAEIARKVEKMNQRIVRLTVAALAFVVLAVAVYLVSASLRGQENAKVLKTLRVNGSPEAQAAQQAYLALFRFQIDCDGRFREQDSDNALLDAVAGTASSPVTFPQIDLADGAKSCKAIPEAERDLAEAAKKLQALRDKIG